MAAPAGQPPPVQYPDFGAVRVPAAKQGRIWVYDVAQTPIVVSMRSLQLLGRWVHVKHATDSSDVLGYFARLQVGGATANTTVPSLAARSGSSPTQQCARLFKFERDPVFIEDPGVNGDGSLTNDWELVFIASANTIAVEIYDAQV